MFAIVNNHQFLFTVISALYDATHSLSSDKRYHVCHTIIKAENAVSDRYISAGQPCRRGVLNFVCLHAPCVSCHRIIFNYTVIRISEITVDIYNFAESAETREDDPCAIMFSSWFLSLSALRGISKLGCHRRDRVEISILAISLRKRVFFNRQVSLSRSENRGGETWRRCRRHAYVEKETLSLLISSVCACRRVE